MKRRYTKPKVEINKILFLIVGFALLMGIIIIRLFYLQVIKHGYYQEVALASQVGFIELPAQRGEILIKDHHSDEEFPLATNTTLSLLYVDPALVRDPVFITKEIAPLLFDLEAARAADDERIQEIKKTLAVELSPEELAEAISPMSDSELQDKFMLEFEEKLRSKQRDTILLKTNINNSLGVQVNNLSLPGIEAVEGSIYAYPPQILDRKITAERLSPLVEIAPSQLEQILKGETRYIVLARKIDPDISEIIKEKLAEERNRPKENSEDTTRFLGLGLQDEYYRFYPEQTLAANIVGFVDRENNGQYGIESTLNSELKGISGKVQTKQDAKNRQLTVGESKIEQAIDGANVVLTIDRSIQLKVEEVLAAAVREYQADSGQIVVMEPFSGKILAMANYPSYDPNAFGGVYKKVEVKLTEEEIKELVETETEDLFWYYTNLVTLDRYQIFRETYEDGTDHYFRYENFVGPEAYINKTVAWPYEPGSVFKTIAMAAAINDGEVTPQTTYLDNGPVGVDWREDLQKFEFEIKNSEDNYMGLVDMTTVLGESLNTGMTFIAKEMGAALFYNYIEQFGFLEESHVGLESEITGKVNYFETWTESELATHSFGQGLTVNMVQLANAYSAIANGGVLMQPYIIDEIRYANGKSTKLEPKQLRRVLKEETAEKMRKMLYQGVEEGVAGNAKVPGYQIAGKTGTSQTYKNGQALRGKGTTITSFAGFAPVNNPKFVILIKFDRPKTVEWGSATAAPTFSKIAEYLVSYYNIMPE